MLTIILFLSLLINIINCGVVPYYSTNYIYIDSSPQRTWEDAAEYCYYNYGTRLASIKASSDQIEILSVTDGTPGGEPKWFGCRSVGDTVRWIQDGTSCTNEIYQTWHLSEAVYELDQCFAFDEPNGKWFDFNCNTKRDFVCNNPGGKYGLIKS